MQEVSWRQKSRETWLKKWAHNTRFFHRLANYHRRNGFISYFCIDSTGTFAQGEIDDTIIQYYKDLFNETVTWRPKVDGLEFPYLDFAEAYWLERPFQEEEVL